MRATITTDSPLTADQRDTLDRIATEVNDEVGLLRSTAMDRAVRIGQRLAEAKTILPHGQFRPWVKQNTCVSPSHADKYLALGSYFRGEKSALIALFDVTSALSFVRAIANDQISDNCESAILTAAKRGKLIDKARLTELRERHGCGAGDWTRAARIAALPDGQYRVLLADPPWQYRDSREGILTHTGSGASSHYPTMPTNVICNMVGPDGRSVCDLAAPDSVLFLWATVPLLPDALCVVDAWGFTYKTSLVWDKVRPYVGNYTSVGHEYLILATRGSYTPEVNDRPYSVIRAERSSRHSEKPVEAFELIETLYPSGPRVELFARSRREGWDCWGNEVATDAA